MLAIPAIDSFYKQQRAIFRNNFSLYILFVFI